MCGIFGLVTNKESIYKGYFLEESLLELGHLSVRRGKDSSGLCAYNQKSGYVDIFKGPITIDELFKRDEIKKAFPKWLEEANQTRFAFGHSRLVTNGTQLNHHNNQPIYKDDIVCVHNGIIVNVDELWDQLPSLDRHYEIDTEVLLSLLRENLRKGYNVPYAVSESIKEVFGTVAAAMLINDLKKLILVTNNGSLYTLTNNEDLLFFGSEQYILHKFKEKVGLYNKGNFELKQIKPGNGICIDLVNYKITPFSLDQGPDEMISNTEPEESFKVNVQTIDSGKRQLSTVVDLNKIHLNPDANREKALLKYPIDQIKQLKRCTKCVLPETFPFIQFDENGVCNYCRSYKKKEKPASLERLRKLVKPYRKMGNKPEVLIPISGGRDSTYVLHTVVRELGLNAISFTYDWGMVTDLARRNIARICGKLEIENIIVAADIHWKRKNIQKNIVTWLKNPELGMIPLFMAGDKFFFYHAYKIKKELGIDLEIWGVNELENTNFKTGFGGLKPEFDKERIYSISFANKLKLFGFVAKNVIKNPGYINQSLLDSLGSFASRYFVPKTDYYHLFDFVRWDEERIENTLFEEYDWEKAIDTDSTWRIGDGTASFYNYIYTLVAGFSENDTFRSNQIREEMISREDALKKVYNENRPRYNSIKWYIEIVGLDFKAVIEKVNQIPRLI